MQLKFGINPIYQAWLFDTLGNCDSLYIPCNTSFFNTSFFPLWHPGMLNILGIGWKYDSEKLHEGSTRENHFFFVIFFFIAELDMYYLGDWFILLYFHVR